MKIGTKGLVGLISGLAMTPVALGVGIVLFVTVDDADDGLTVPATGSLLIGRAGVPPQYAELINDAADACDAGLSASVLAAQLKQESGFNAQARSSVGAQGIAQFMPGTWRSRGVDGDGDGAKDVWNPQDAIPAQGRFMCSLLKQGQRHPEYNGAPIELALAGYNAGWGRVEQFKGVPPVSFARGQTYHYVQTIMKTAAALSSPSVGDGEALLPVGYELPSGTPRQIRQAVAWALKQRGGWYRLGGDCTDALGKQPAHWCDCTSLTQQAYAAAGISIPRVTYDQVNIGRRVDITKPKPGDLVFNAGSDGSDARPGHVGLYVGDGMLVEAPRTGVKTRLVPYNSWLTSTSALTRITEVRRVVDW